MPPYAVYILCGLATLGLAPWWVPVGVLALSLGSEWGFAYVAAKYQPESEAEEDGHPGQYV